MNLRLVVPASTQALWFYYAAQLFLINAEFNWVYANTFGSQRPHPIQGVHAHETTHIARVG